MLPRRSTSLGLRSFLVAACLAWATAGLSSVRADSKAAGYVYPKAAKGDVVDVFHGEKVADPYRALEDPDAPQTREWIEAENKITFDFLGTIAERSAIRDRLTQVWDYEKFGLPRKRGGRYIFSKNDGLQNQSVVYWAKSLDGEPTLLLDPNKLSADGTISLTGSDVTDDGRLLAYGLSQSGSDWQEWKVRDIESGKDLDDQIKWVKFSGASWTKDGKGFFYSRYDEPKPGEELTKSNFFHKLYYHKLATKQADDVLIYERPDQKDWGFGGYVTEDGKYLVINVWKGTERKNLLFYQELGDKSRATIELIKKFEAEFDFIENTGYTFLFRTDLDAPRGRVIAIDIRNPDRENWKELIPQSEHTLQNVSLVGGEKLVATYLKHATTLVKVFESDGKFIRDVPLPGLGTAFGFGGLKDDPETFFSFTSFTDPGTILRYDMNTGEQKVIRRPKLAFRPEDFQTRQAFYKSKDGTEIPIFITFKKGALSGKGDSPTLLYGYGGFNASMTPSFSPRYIPWMEMGGVYAVANLRGGGEYGKDWHEAGKKLKKQNVFDDFIAAGEFLIKQGFTKPDKLAILGGSNGGLLVGACMIQRPDLFGAAVPIVGVMDMLRFHKFTIGHAWVSDYGSPDNTEEFKALYAYSPYHTLKAADYPATLVLTGDHDDRVVPAHSFKFAARLQELHTGKDPVLIRIQTKAGHGAGKPTSMQIEEWSDVWSFLVKTLNMKVDLSSAPAPKKEKNDSAG